ncbi:c-type cytochrome [Bordetella genomosp. 2]|uniref:Cytochrome C n=1 Tax=Bordetella genomosp. 2 TaxID=1983456 RepID=A0A261VQM8_9BORD|nr:c-type cytochrome [Bordetella genomosp. 2]OZI76406.1 cytochrome C [Bordetella genomosp. 2]
MHRLTFAVPRARPGPPTRPPRRAPGASPARPRRLAARLAAAVPAVALLAALAGCGEPPAPLAATPQAGALAGADSARGRERIVAQGCVSCHSIPGIKGAGARVGPPLGHLAKRAYLGGVLANTSANLVRWLRDPPAIAPHTAMPNLRLSEAEARDIAAYLLTLR